MDRTAVTTDAQRHEDQNLPSSPLRASVPPCLRASPPPTAFTLIEMVVVMGIILIIILIAIPAIRTLTGSRSVDGAYNTLSAVITRAREEAVGIQDVRGVLFWLDPATDRVNASIVQSVPLDTGDTARYYLDLVPDRDFLALPPGIGCQVVNSPDTTPVPWAAGQSYTVGNKVTTGSVYVCINNNIAATTNQPPTAAYWSPSFAITDRYIGLNPPDSNTATAITSANGNAGVRVGGVILFDGNGRLISASYGLKMHQPNSTTPSNLAQSIYGCDSTKTLSNDFTPANAPSSQFGFVLFDQEAFLAQGFTRGDPNLDTTDSNISTTNEKNEETWLDTNSTPILINRYNGTLIRAE